MLFPDEVRRVQVANGAPASGRGSGARERGGQLLAGGAAGRREDDRDRAEPVAERRREGEAGRPNDALAVARGARRNRAGRFGKRGHPTRINGRRKQHAVRVNIEVGAWAWSSKG